MLAIIVCAAVLVIIAYFAALCGMEVLWSLRDRVHSSELPRVQSHTITRRRVLTR